MPLLGLPPELLDHIITLTFRHGGFKSVVQACKTTYYIGKPLIPRYNQLTRSWGATCVNSRDSLPGPLDVIRAILVDPDIAWFIESLDLRNSAFPAAREETDKLGDDEMRALRDVMEQCPYLIPAGQNIGDWISNMGLDPLEDNEGDSRDNVEVLIYRTTFLLSLLPSLEELTLPDKWVYFQDTQSSCGEVIKAIIDMVRHSGSSDDLPLGKLERLHPFEHIEYDPHPRSGLGIVAPFMALPNLKALEVSNLIAVDDGHTGIPFEWPYPEFESNVLSVILDGCCVDAGGIAELLKHTPQIKSLTYSHHTKWHGCQHDWDAGAFVDAIAEQCGETLTELSVTTGDLFGDVETGIVSLKNFKSLQKATLDVSVFCAPPLDSGKRLGTRGPAPKPEDWTIQDIPHLSGILPGSMKYVQLIANNDDAAMTALRKLLGGLVDLTASRMFPRLERLIVRHTRNPIWTAERVEHGEFPIRTVLEAAGAKLLLLD